MLQKVLGVGGWCFFFFSLLLIVGCQCRGGWGVVPSGFVYVNPSVGYREVRQVCRYMVFGSRASDVYHEV